MSTIGIGGSTAEIELNAIVPNGHLVKPIQKEEFQLRINKACELMQAQNVQAIYLHAGSNLFYFTGTHWVLVNAWWALYCFQMANFII